MCVGEVLLKQWKQGNILLGKTIKISFVKYQCLNCGLDKYSTLTCGTFLFATPLKEMSVT